MLLLASFLALADAVRFSYPTFSDSSRLLLDRSNVNSSRIVMSNASSIFYSHSVDLNFPFSAIFTFSISDCGGLAFVGDEFTFAEYKSCPRRWTVNSTTVFEDTPDISSPRTAHIKFLQDSISVFTDNPAQPILKLTEYSIPPKDTYRIGFVSKNGGAAIHSWSVYSISTVDEAVELECDPGFISPPECPIGPKHSIGTCMSFTTCTECYLSPEDCSWCGEESQCVGAGLATQGVCSATSCTESSSSHVLLWIIIISGFVVSFALRFVDHSLLFDMGSKGFLNVFVALLVNTGLIESLVDSFLSRLIGFSLLLTAWAISIEISSSLFRNSFHRVSWIQCCLLAGVFAFIFGLSAMERAASSVGSRCTLFSLTASALSITVLYWLAELQTITRKCHWKRAGLSVNQTIMLVSPIMCALYFGVVFGNLDYDLGKRNLKLELRRSLVYFYPTSFLSGAIGSILHKRSVEKNRASECETYA